jgi:uncharacterized NAD(P)/FAD-binding protein YdhS
VVVGGGAAGTVAALALRRADADVDVTVVDRSPVAGPGFAYATSEPLYLLNNYVSRMSALEDDADHLLDWCVDRGISVTPDTFLPRGTYGRYLADLAANLSVTRVRAEVVDVAPAQGGHWVRLDNGVQLRADELVLALGNPPARPISLPAVDPWDPDLAARAGEVFEVLLLGTGLTAVDVAARLAQVNRDLRIVAASHHARLPARHLPTAPALVPGYEGPFGAGRRGGGARAGGSTAVPDLRSVLADVRRRGGEGEDWRGLVEALKGSANRLWSGWSDQDRTAFLRHASRWWELHRHRMAPPMADRIDRLRQDGRLSIRRIDSVDPTAYRLVVNCTGPAPTWPRGSSRLVDALLARGLVGIGPLGLGLASRAPHIHLLGAARRGTEWEVTAVPDLRRQAEALADRIVRTTEERELVNR